MDIRHVRHKLSGHRPTPLGIEPEDHAAVAVVLREGPVSAEVLLIERAVHERDPWSGHMAFPGGRMDPQDESLRSTAARETREEVGIDLAGAEYLGHIDELVGNRRFASKMVVAAHAFHLEAHQEFELEPSEVQHALWFPLVGLHERERQIEHVLPELPDVRFPGIVVGQPDRHVVWGLTFRFLERMLGVLEHPFERRWGNLDRYEEQLRAEARR